MELFYRKSGKGLPLIILHGMYGSSDNWASIARQLDGNYTVYTVDQRNHGRSPHSDTHTYPELAQDLKELMDKEQIGRAIILGHSMGGKTAIQFSREFPERVSALIIVDISPKNYYHGVSHEKNGLSHDAILRALNSLDLSTIHSREEADEALSEDIPDTFLRMFLLKNLHREGNRFSWTFNIPVLIRSFDSIAGGFDDSWLEEPVTGFPVLFIKGSESRYITEADYPRIYAIYPQADIEVVQGAGHAVHAEQPEAFVATVKSFLAKL